MPKYRKMINFDLDTKKYEKVTNKPSPTAYYQIHQYMENNDFMHRQGSCYISKNELNGYEVFEIVTVMSKKFPWLNECVKECDVTDITKNMSLLDTIKNASNNDISNLKESNIAINQKNELDIDINLEIQKE